MLSRYTLYRGPRPAGDPLPDGIRQDTRKHTRHILRPEAKMVTDYLRAPGEAAWRRFNRDYLALLDERFRTQRGAFDALASLAMENDVFLGCSCPTKRNPDPRHCHTFAALRFMKKKYPGLRVMLPRTCS